MTFRISEAAALLGVSSDTVRRWVDGGRLRADRDEHGHRRVDGADLAAFARAQIEEPTRPAAPRRVTAFAGSSPR